MNFLNHPEKLPEKLGQADLVAFGYKWGKREGVVDLARQIHAAIATHNSLIKGILEILSSHSHDSKNNGGQNDGSK